MRANFLIILVPPTLARSFMETLLPYGRQEITEEDKQAVLEALSQDVITRGEKVALLEEKIKEMTNAPYAVAFSSGTMALFAAYFAAKVSKFDQVVTTPVTFASTATPAIRFGAHLEFGDIDPETGNFSLDFFAKEQNFSSSRGRRVFVPVHFGGQPIAMDQFERQLTSPSTVIIEDAAHALGATYPTGEAVGSCAFSDMTIFSFHPLKSITSGEGGCVTASSQAYADRLRRFRDNGICRDPSQMGEEVPGPWYYEVVDLGENGHLTEMQGALGLSQLGRLDQMIAKRQSLYENYLERLKKTEGIKPLHVADPKASAHHLFAVKIDFETFETTRKEVMEKLKERGIGTQVHYIPLYKFPLFKSYDASLGIELPGAEAYYQKALTLPLHPQMNEGDVNRVCDELFDVLGLAVGQK